VVVGSALAGRASRCFDDEKYLTPVGNRRDGNPETMCPDTIPAVQQQIAGADSQLA
jgi:hypothetical protein